MRLAVSLFLTLLLLSSITCAQSALPDAPSAIEPAKAPVAVIKPAIRATRTADAAYWSLLGLSAAAMVADVETTVRAVQNPRCREANPFLGEHPTRATMYAMKGGLGALVATFSYVGKKKGWSKWWLIPLLTTGAHGGVAVSNWRTGCF